MSECSVQNRAFYPFSQPLGAVTSIKKSPTVGPVKVAQGDVFNVGRVRKGHIHGHVARGFGVHRIPVRRTAADSTAMIGNLFVTLHVGNRGIVWGGHSNIQRRAVGQQWA